MADRLSLAPDTAVEIVFGPTEAFGCSVNVHVAPDWSSEVVLVRVVESAPDESQVPLAKVSATGAPEMVGPPRGDTSVADHEQFAQVVESESVRVAVTVVVEAKAELASNAYSRIMRFIDLSPYGVRRIVRPRQER